MSFLENEFWLNENKSQKHKQSKKTTTLKTKRKKPTVALNAENVRDGLAQLVLTVVELLREVMEKQAVRRIESDSLTEEQIEELGLTFQKLKSEVKRLREYFKLKEDDLNLDLGPLGRLRETPSAGEMSKEVTLVELLDRVLDKGVAVRGDIVLSVAEVDLVIVNLGLLIASMETAMKAYEKQEEKETKEKIKELNNRIKELEKEKKKLQKIAVTAKTHT